MKGDELKKDLDEIRVDANKAIIEIVKKYGKKSKYNETWTLSLNWIKFNVIGISIEDGKMSKEKYGINSVTYHPLREGYDDEITFLDGNGNGLDAGCLELIELIRALSRLEIITERLSDCSIFNF